MTLAPSMWSCRELEANGVGNVRLWKRGVNLENFQPMRRDESLRSELSDNGRKTIVGYVGRLANEKRIDDLAILDSQPDIQIVIVGIGPAEAKLKRALPNALFVGYQSGLDLARYVASFDLFVHTGKHETFCQSIQEALASGVPVIGPNSGGPVDLIDHGKTGLLIDTAQPLELLAAVNVLRSSSKYQEMRVAARKAVMHRTWNYINSQLMKHYQDAIALQQVKKEVAA
jgi:phosphatidylinositol alpha 1,6-mannosyltransferase